MAEAAAQFHKALEQLALLPDGRERQQRELELRSALGTVLFAVKGQAAPETGQAFTRARELWEQLGSPRGSCGLPMGRLVITRSAANWMRHCAWMRACCV